MKLSGVILWGCLCSLAVCAEPIGTVWPVWRGDAALTGRAWTKLLSGYSFAVIWCTTKVNNITKAC